MRLSLGYKNYFVNTYSLLLVFFIVIDLNVFSQTGSIMNIQVYQRTDGSGNVDIFYDLVGPGSSYFISMEVSFNNGNTFTAVSPAFLTGNVGLVTSGNNMHILWNGKGSNNNIYNVQTKIKLIIGTCVQCDQPITVNHVAGNIDPVNKTVTYGTVTNIPGEPSKCWITSNLGADRQALAVDDATEASAGWHWQFNRRQGYKHDGIIRTPTTIWITAINENLDWHSANDPCFLELGNGWRIPSTSEWENVNMSGNWTDWNDPWNSGLKLHAAGYLDYSNGSPYYRGSYGYYWSSTQCNSGYGWALHFFSNASNVYDNGKAYGFSLRCLRDY